MQYAITSSFYFSDDLKYPLKRVHCYAQAHLLNAIIVKFTGHIGRQTSSSHLSSFNATCNAELLLMPLRAKLLLKAHSALYASLT